MRALEELADAGVIIEAISSCYETAPQGGPPQAAYLNLACRVRWPGSTLQLLDLCQQIEKKLGRVRKVRWGPRRIDIDLLLVGQQIILRDRLQVPHPQMESRAFVLVPAVELAPEMVHPILERTIQELLEELPQPGEVKRREWPEGLRERVSRLAD